MLRKALTTSLILVLISGISACTIITGEDDSPIFDGDSTTLSLMLQAVPPAGTTTLMYNDITALSEYRGQKIPSRTASIEEKLEWWKSIQDNILWGYPFPIITDLWGFDAVDVSGILTFWGDGPVTILSGDLDTTAFRRKLLSYGYAETTYLGLPVFSGIPEPNENIKPDIRPRAFGIINGVRTGTETINFIVMSGSGDDDVESARQGIEATIAAYRQKTSLADVSNPLTKLADAVGKVGAAYITTENRLNMALEISKGNLAEWMRAATGPGELRPYDAVAMTYRGESGRTVFDFILAYDTPAAAAAGMPVLRERLVEGRFLHLYDTPLSEVWTIEDVTSSGSLLRATVHPLDTAPLGDLLFVSMVYAVDYWFLYTGS